MPFYRFVEPDTTTLTLADGETLIVKKRLTTGERRHAQDGPQIEFALRMVLAYLVDWTLKDKDGVTVKPYGRLDEAARRDTLDNMDEDDYSEIEDAVWRHRETMRTAREAEKKMAGALASPSISVSPSAAAGAMSGSPDSMLMSTTS